MRSRRIANTRNRSGAQSGIAVLAPIVLILVTVVVALALAWVVFYWLPMASSRNAISDAFNGDRDPLNTNRYEWECRWDCTDWEWLRDLPPVSKVTCYQILQQHGACCGASFEGGIYAEIHVFRLGGGRYKIRFYSYPMCPSPGGDPSDDPRTLAGQKLVRCDDRWRS